MNNPIISFYLQINQNVEFFSVKFNHNENKVSSLAYQCRNGVAVSDKFGTNKVYIFSFKKHEFASRVFTFMLVYWKQLLQMQESFRMLQYLLAKKSINVIAGEFIYDLLNVLENKLLAQTKSRW